MNLSGYVLVFVGLAGTLWGLMNWAATIQPIGIEWLSVLLSLIIVALGLLVAGRPD